MQRIITQARVPDYVFNMVKVVKDDSGYWPLLVEDDELPWDSQVSAAHEERLYHEVSFSPAYVGHRHHLFFRGCVEVMRDWIACKYGRSSRGNGAAALPERIAALKARHQEAAIPTRELVYRLTAWPGVLNAEAGTREYRGRALEQGIHKRQELYLARRLQDLREELSQEPSGPPELQEPLAAMAWAFSASAYVILRARRPSYLEENRHRVGGQRLLACVRDMDFDGNLGDMQVTEAWIEELDLDRLLDW